MLFSAHISKRLHPVHNAVILHIYILYILNIYIVLHQATSLALTLLCLKRLHGQDMKLAKVFGGHALKQVFQLSLVFTCAAKLLHWEWFVPSWHFYRLCRWWIILLLTKRLPEYHSHNPRNTTQKPIWLEKQIYSKTRAEWSIRTVAIPSGIPLVQCPEDISGTHYASLQVEQTCGCLLYALATMRCCYTSLSLAFWLPLAQSSPSMCVSSLVT